MLFSVKPLTGTLRYTGIIASFAINVFPSEPGSVACNLTFPLPFSPAVINVGVTVNEPAV